MSVLKRLFGGRSGIASDRLIEPTGEASLGPCACCNANRRRVWGLVHRGEVGEAAYFVQWIPGQVGRYGARFDLILGEWGEGTDRAQRYAVALEFRFTSSGPAFMVIDAVAGDAPWGEVAGRGLRREEAIGTPTAQQAFDIVDALWLQDERLSEIRAAG
jgi:hypothetical protein